jgi:hypothetical protein
MSQMKLLLIFLAVLHILQIKNPGHDLIFLVSLRKSTCTLGPQSLSICGALEVAPPLGTPLRFTCWYSSDSLSVEDNKGLACLQPTYSWLGADIHRLRYSLLNGWQL